MKIEEFINTRFKPYADYDNFRNIPSSVDGLKISQRKAIWTFYDVLGKDWIIVDRASMRCAEHTHYKHGAQNMYDVLIGLAQDFAGTNNIAILDQDGQFGTRLIHDASSPRYIETRLGENFNKLFNKDDFDLVSPMLEEGQKVEPTYLLPSLPLHIINGSSGIGNGFSCTILQYKPSDVVSAINEYLKNGFVSKNLVPWSNGFNGLITKNQETGQVTYYGNLEVTNSNTITITEVPPGMTLDKYKVILNELVDEKFIKDYENESANNTWKIICDVPRTTSSLKLEVLLDKFKLIQKETENITVWDINGKIKKYSSIESLLYDWVDIRLDIIDRRKANIISNLQTDLDWLKVKIQYIMSITNPTVFDTVIRFKKNELREWMKLITTNEKYIDRLIDIRVVDLTVDMVDELKKKEQSVVDAIDKLSKSDSVSIMKNELKGMKL